MVRTPVKIWVRVDIDLRLGLGPGLDFLVRVWIRVRTRVMRRKIMVGCAFVANIGLWLAVPLSLIGLWLAVPLSLIIELSVPLSLI